MCVCVLCFRACHLCHQNSDSHTKLPCVSLVALFIGIPDVDECATERSSVANLKQESGKVAVKLLPCLSFVLCSSESLECERGVWSQDFSGDRATLRELRLK